MGEPSAAGDVFRAPRLIRCRLKFNAERINDINRSVQELCRERSEYERRNADLRSELKAQCEPDGHLPGCSRSDRCPGEGWCE